MRRLVLSLALVVACARQAGPPAPLPSPVVIRIPSGRLTARATPPVPASLRSLLADALICAGGDVMLGSNLDTAWARAAHGSGPGDPLPLPPPDRLVAPLRPLVDDAAVVLINVEGAIGEGPVSTKCRRGGSLCYQFRQQVAAAAALRGLLPQGAVVGNVANNHAMDAGPEGYEATRRHLRESGIRVTGGDTLAAIVPLPSGDTVAFLGFSTFSAGPDARDLEAVRRHVRRAADRYGHVVVNVHNGAEGREAQRTRDQTERFAGEDRGNPVAFARAAVESGASVVFGHGPHVLRAVEWRGRSLVVYSLGNLLTHGPFNRNDPQNRGGFACVRLSREGGVFWAEFRSIRQEPPGVALPDSSNRAAHLIDSLSALDFPQSGGRIVEGVIFRR